MDVYFGLGFLAALLIFILNWFTTGEPFLLRSVACPVMLIGFWLCWLYVRMSIMGAGANRMSEAPQPRWHRPRPLTLVILTAISTAFLLANVWQRYAVTKTGGSSVLGKDDHYRLKGTYTYSCGFPKTFLRMTANVERGSTIYFPSRSRYYKPEMWTNITMILFILLAVFIVCELFLPKNWEPVQFSLSGLALGVVVAAGLWAWQQEALTHWQEWTNGSLAPHVTMLCVDLLYLMCIAANYRRIIAWLQS